jgi:hypothetical protein
MYGFINYQHVAHSRSYFRGPYTPLIGMWGIGNRTVVVERAVEAAAGEGRTLQLHRKMLLRFQQMDHYTSREGWQSN